MTSADKSPPVDDRDALHHLPPHVLAKAARPGRMRGIALDVWREARVRPRQAGRILRDGVKQARALHSRERRLVREALYGLVRGHVRWAHQLGDDTPEALWLAQLVEAGLPVEVAQEEVRAPYERLGDPVKGSDAERLATWHGWPSEMVVQLIDAMGVSDAERFLQASDRRAPVTLRANTRIGSREQLAERLAGEGIETVPGKLSSTALHLVGRANLPASPSFRAGAFEVQDEGSQLLAAHVPAVARVWDVCAGAGGKALALAARGAKVLATDVRGGALAEARKRAGRARVRLQIEPIAPDGALPAAVTRFEPQAVLVDAPCSGTGVMRRHPEHRWLWDGVGDLPALQLQILRRAAAAVPAGGVLVYGTCSVLPAENEEVVAAFLQEHADFAIDGDALRLSPHRQGTDGFFAQRLSRSHPLQSTASDHRR